MSSTVKSYPVRLQVPPVPRNAKTFSRTENFPRDPDILFSPCAGHPVRPRLTNNRTCISQTLLGKQTSAPKSTFPYRDRRIGRSAQLPPLSPSPEGLSPAVFPTQDMNRFQPTAGLQTHLLQPRQLSYFEQTAPPSSRQRASARLLIGW